MDEAIKRAVTQHKAVLAMKWQWMLDQWKYDMGMLEVLSGPDENDEDYFKRRFRNAPVHGPKDEPYRFLPFFNGYGVMVRDKR